MSIENIAIMLSIVSYQKIKRRWSLFSITLAKDGVLAVVEGEDFLDLIQPPDNEEPPYYSMLRTFPKAFFQMETSEGYFPRGQLSKCKISQVATSQVCPSRSTPPLDYLAAALGPLAAPQKAKPNLWKVATWEISQLASYLWKLPLGKYISFSLNGLYSVHVIK